MALTSGTKLGPYEIQSPLGAGGMGEVYRALDTRLDRIVAVKVLASHLSSSPELKQRMDREARAISSLNHPNICHLYDIGSQDGTDYLVMEFLEGETLAERLRKGAMPLNEIFKVGIAVAEALAFAHRSGIVHRDLKPGNIMLTQGGAKLMDFGLAKPLGVQTTANGSGAAPSFTAAATFSGPSPLSPLTTAGSIIGTIQYMAPEQVEGKEADARSDIFAFGAVLYEMATGKRAFAGKSQISVASAILESAPEPISSIQPLTPPAFEHVVLRSLAKHPDERWQNAGDVRGELQWISEGGLRSVPTQHQARSNRGLVIAATLAVLFAALAGFQYWRMRTVTPTNLEFNVSAPEKATLDTMGWNGAPAISPDGNTIAFLATTTEGVKSLWVRPLDSTESHPLPQTENATYPFWSPDSRFLGFFAEGKLKKIAVNGGGPIALCDAGDGRGGSWSERGFIIFGLRDGPLQKVPVAGGSPTAITQLDISKSESSHRFPALLPDGDHYLFVVQDAHPHLSSSSLKSGLRLADFSDIDSSVAYSQGNLFFVRGATLFAQPFDPTRLQFGGDPVTLAEKVQFDPQFNFGIFSVSGNGELVYQGGASSLSTQLVWLDRTGKQIGSAPGSGRYWSISLSPAGTQLLVQIDEASTDRSAIWLFDLVAGTRTRLTFNGWQGYPVWSHNGRKIAFSVGQNGAELHMRDLASGAESTLFSLPGGSEAEGWSPDDRYILFDLRNPGANWEIGVADTTGQHNRYPLIQNSGYARWARLSPDGKWLAYVGVETGYPEIYVAPVDFTGAQPKAGANKSQISTAGGLLPVWSRDGKELFFTNVSMTILYAAPFATADGIVHAGAANKLFDLSSHSYAFFYDVSPDGKRFYVAEAPPGSASPLTVVTNWEARIKK